MASRCPPSARLAGSWQMSFLWTKLHVRGAQMYLGKGVGCGSWIWYLVFLWLFQISIGYRVYVSVESMDSKGSIPPSPLSSVHAAVIAINEAIDHGAPEGTLTAMQNPNAMLVNLDASSAHQYHDTLYQAKGEKVANSRKRVCSFITDGVTRRQWKEWWPAARHS